MQSTDFEHALAAAVRKATRRTSASHFKLLLIVLEAMTPDQLAGARAHLGNSCRLAFEPRNALEARACALLGIEHD